MAQETSSLNNESKLRWKWHFSRRIPYDGLQGIPLTGDIIGGGGKIKTQWTRHGA